MNSISLLGILGGILLVIGASLPLQTVSHPIRSAKNWLYVIGTFILMIFSYLDYKYNGAPFFFTIYEIYLVLASILMFMNVPERISILLLTLGGIGMVAWSVLLFEDYSTVIFILGCIGLALGYILKTGTRKRNFVLFLASALLALFSYISFSWTFFWLNVFFSVFSAWHSLPSKHKS